MRHVGPLIGGARPFSTHATRGPADPFIEEAWTTRPLAPPTQNTDTNPDTTTNTDTSYDKQAITDINNDNGSNTLNIYINTTYSF